MTGVGQARRDRPGGREDPVLRWRQRGAERPGGCRADSLPSPGALRLGSWQTAGPVTLEDDGGASMPS